MLPGESLVDASILLVVCNPALCGAEFWDWIDQGVKVSVALQGLHGLLDGVKAGAHAVNQVGDLRRSHALEDRLDESEKPGDLPHSHIAIDPVV